MAMRAIFGGGAPAAPTVSATNIANQKNENPNVKDMTDRQLFEAMYLELGRDRADITSIQTTMANPSETKNVPAHNTGFLP